MGKGGHYLRPNPKNPGKKSIKVMLLTLLIAFLLIAGGLAGVILFVFGKIQPVPMPTDAYTTEGVETMQTETTAAESGTTAETTVDVLEAIPSGEQDILNVLVVGQAAREGEESRLADTMILVTVNKMTKVLTMTSLLRDTYVDLPAYAGHGPGRNKINTCYALGWYRRSHGNDQYLFEEQFWHRGGL